MADESKDSKKSSVEDVKTGMHEDRNGFSMTMAEDEYNYTELTGDDT